MKCLWIFGLRYYINSFTYILTCLLICMHRTSVIYFASKKFYSLNWSMCLFSVSRRDGGADWRRVADSATSTHTEIRQQRVGGRLRRLHRPGGCWRWKHRCSITVITRARQDQESPPQPSADRITTATFHGENPDRPCTASKPQLNVTYLRCLHHPDPVQITRPISYQCLRHVARQAGVLLRGHSDHHFERCGIHIPLQSSRRRPRKLQWRQREWIRCEKPRRQFRTARQLDAKSEVLLPGPIRVRQGRAVGVEPRGSSRHDVQ